MTRNRRARRHRRAARGAGRRTTLDAVRAATSPAPATPPTACCAAWASTTPRPPPSCAATRTARKLLDGRGGKMVQARSRRRRRADRTGGALSAPSSAAARQPHFTRLTRRAQRRPLARPHRDRAAGRPGAPGQRHDPQLAVRRHRRGAHPRRRGRADGRDLRRPTSTSTASCARATPSAWSTRRSPPTASRSPGTSAPGRVLAAEFVNNGQAHHAVWFQDASGKGAYFGLDGQSKRRAFLASPMEFSRVTSGFAMRMHPILQTWRAHHGVDYGAPDRHAGAHRRRRRGRVRRLAERLRQRGADPARQRAHARSMRT